MSYIVYDNNTFFPIKQINCMSCLKEVIAMRDVEIVNGKQAYYMRNNSSMNRKRVYMLNNGKPTYVDLMICNECVKTALNIPFLIEQIKDGIRVTMKSEKRTDEEINKILDEQYNLTEVRK